MWAASPTSQRPAGRGLGFSAWSRQTRSLVVQALHTGSGASRWSPRPEQGRPHGPSTATMMGIR